MREKETQKNSARLKTAHAKSLDNTTSLKKQDPSQKFPMENLRNIFFGKIQKLHFENKPHEMEFF